MIINKIIFKSRGLPVAALFLGFIFFLLYLRIVLLFSLLIFPLPENITNDYSETFYYNDKSAGFIKLNKEEQFRVYSKIEEVSPYLRKGIIEYEDKLFYFHPGFNPFAFVRAVILNSKNKRIVSGGSTITMQIARLSEPKERNISGKLIEVFRSMQFESIYSKNKILELYLNTIPMGGNIQGIGAASFFYFGKPPKELSFAESALLIGISNSPNTNNPVKYPQHALISRNKAAVKINKIFKIDNIELKKILQAGIPKEKITFNQDIISLVEKFKMSPFKSERTFSIDKNLQKMCFDIIKEKMTLSETTNGALIVIENETMKVRAYIGSPFYEKNYAGSKINASSVRRSPGSTLKPFIYAKAMEKGLITQKRKILDIPKDFSGYKPKNFSNTYFGVIGADEALYRSLNIPAIQLEQKLGDNGLQSILRNTGFFKITDKPDKDDLSIVLGSFPMSLENMAELYASLANEGIFNNIIFFEDEKKSAGKKILSKESSFIISEILSETFRPDLNSSWEYTKDKPKVAYKTGTSYGFVDAWAIGYTPKYTVAVWIGNLDNKFTKSLTGYGVTAPVLFKIINELGRKNDFWFKKPENVSERKVCTVSGMLPGKFCTNFTKEYFIKGMSSNEICDIHKRIIIDKKTKLVIPINQISEKGNYEEKIIESWPEEVDNFIRKYGKSKTEMIDGNYLDISPDNPIIITSPSEKIKYRISLNKNISGQKIMLSAYDFPDSKNFYWYINDKFIGKVKSSENLFFIPDEKELSISVTDEAGRIGNIKISVEFTRT
jgi:penicillin-binding protein 1C